jgi:hypothetical protein
MLALIFAFKVEERFSVTGLATLALAIATIFLAWDAHQQLPIFSGQLEEMTKAVGVAEKTANAAIEANNLTRNTFVLGQRPWVFYDHLATKIKGPLVLDNGGEVNMDLELFLRNTGHTIVKGVGIYATMFFLSHEHFNKVEEQKKWCAAMRNFTTPYMRTQFSQAIP